MRVEPGSGNHIHVNGIDIAVRDSGSGIPLIWAHGLTSSMRLEDDSIWFRWDTVAGVVRLVRYDARGHGRSGGNPIPTDYTWANLAADMVAVANHLGMDRFIAGGRSMGCGSALQAALNSPKSIKGLVLYTPPTAWETRSNQKTVYQEAAKLVDRYGSEFFAKALTASPSMLQPDWLHEAYPALASTEASSVSKMRPDILAAVLRGAGMSDLPAPEVIANISVPSLILAWEGDDAHPLSTATRLHEYLPLSRLIVARQLSDLKAWPKLISDFVIQV